ncbi:hypothetical protein BIW11_03673 [Tropilaelaps mercedesae]|uniref:Uncharacterized protein n=1 Tax=Tropilaelaps mercedesae TaxID=418985 RepID=A0A1V9XHY1_9ACAR|nr:hypothetical protein BIW11_03673 [Tropilaelaps mercedesae]
MAHTALFLLVFPFGRPGTNRRSCLGDYAPLPPPPLEGVPVSPRQIIDMLRVFAPSVTLGSTPDNDSAMPLSARRLSNYVYTLLQPWPTLGWAIEGLRGPGRTRQPVGLSRIGAEWEARRGMPEKIVSIADAFIDGRFFAAMKLRAIMSCIQNNFDKTVPKPCPLSMITLMESFAENGRQALGLPSDYAAAGLCIFPKYPGAVGALSYCKTSNVRKKRSRPEDMVLVDHLHLNRLNQRPEPPPGAFGPKELGPSARLAERLVCPNRPKPANIAGLVKDVSKALPRTRRTPHSL